jgi:hypothetical protein
MKAFMKVAASLLAVGFETSLTPLLRIAQHTPGFKRFGISIAKQSISCVKNKTFIRRRLSQSTASSME